MQFTSAMTGSLAWPVGAVVLGFGLRGSIVELLNRVTALEAGGVKLSVAARSVEAVRSLDGGAPSILLDQRTADVPQNVPADYDGEKPDGSVEGQIEQTPAAAEAASGQCKSVMQAVNGDSIVRSAWGRLQYALRRILNVESRFPGPVTDTRLISILASRQSISSETAEALENLRRVKSDVVSGRAQASYADARAFEKSADLILSEIMAGFSDPGAAAAILGQGDLATMNYEQLKERLKQEFPISRK